MSKIQNEGVKSEAELIAGGGTKSQLINDTKIYVTAEGLNKRLDEAIIDGDIGGGGVGGINHILDQSEDATLWTNDVNFTITDNTTNPLRGDQDLLIEKAGVDASGEVVSVPFTIDDADKGKKLPLSFDYKNSGTYQDGDYEIEIYDVSSAIVVSNTNPSIISQDNFTASHVTYWDANFASTSYELRVKCITADTNTSSMQVDNLQTGPVNCKAGGSFISDWIDFTPTGSWTTNTTYTGKYRRVGGVAEIKYKAEFSGAPAPAVSFYVDAPSGLSVDETKLFISSGNSYVGGGQLVDLGSNRVNVDMHYAEGLNYFFPRPILATGTYGTLNITTPTSPFAVANTDSFEFTVTAPIQGWGTGIKPAEVISGRTFVAEGVGNAETVITAAVTNIDFTVTRDEGGAFSGTEYTAQETGDYNVDGMVFFQGAPQFRAVDTYRDTGSGYAEYKRVGSTLTDGAFHFSGNVFLNKGDKLAFRMAGVGGTLSNSIPSVHWVKISKENSLNAQLLPDDTASNINAVIVSDWEDFTPTGSWTTNVNYTGRYRRVGDSAEIEITAIMDGATDAANLAFNMPAGLAVDSSKQSTTTRSGQGAARLVNAGVNQSYTCTSYYLTTTEQIQITHSTPASNFGLVSNVSPFTFGASDSVSLRITLPIQGWETGIKPTEVVEGRLHTFSVRGGAALGGSNQLIPDSVHTKLTNFGTPNIDTSAGWSAVNNHYVCQESGLYIINWSIRVGSDPDGDLKRVIGTPSINGVQFWGAGSDFNIATNFAYGNGSKLAELQKGDLITLDAYQDNTDNDSLNVDVALLELVKFNQLSAQIQPTETVTAKYKDTSGQLLTGTGSVISYPTKVHDTHNMMNGSFDTFIIPVSGLYLVSGSIGTAGGTPFAADANVQLRAVKNGIDITRSFTRTRASSTSYMVETLAQEYFTAGDTLQLYYYGSVNTNADTTDFRNYTAITKIGN